MKKKINISDKTLKIIKKDQIKPIPKWEFLIKNWSLWLGLGLCLLLAVVGIGLSWFGIFDEIITPYFWVIIALVFLGLSFSIFEKTKKAYHFEKWQVITFISMVGLIMGGILFQAGLAAKIDRNLESNIPYYREMVPMKLKVWNNPVSGYLSGEIVEITNINNFKIRDFNNNFWSITGQDPLIRGRVQFIIGEEIKLIGKQLNDSRFEVEEIRPWSGRGQNMMKEN